VSSQDYVFAEPKRPRRRGWLKTIVMTLVVGLVLSVASLGGFFVYVNAQIQASGIDVFEADGDKFELPTAAQINGPINMLLIGSDTRQDQGANYGDHEGELADVIMLLHIAEDRNNAVAMSFPRDLIIDVPQCPNPDGEPFAARENVQINATMATGGPACTLLAVQALTGVVIPYLAVIDFKGVIAMSEVVGGVDVCVAQPIDDPKSKLQLEAGEHTLIGEQALAFLRTRYGVGDGSDLSRISNQQVFLTSLVRKLKGEGVLSNPFKMFTVATAAVDNMILSRSLTDLGVMLGMAREVNQVDLDKITFIKLPVYSMEGEYAGRVGLIPDQSELLFTKLRNDEPLILAEANPGQGAVVVEDENTSTESNAGSAQESGPDVAATSTPEDEPLPEWVQGTNASTKSCSN
jgi:LCP family protein required for cell wall assembly